MVTLFRFRLFSNAMTLTRHPAQASCTSSTRKVCLFFRHGNPMLPSRSCHLGNLPKPERRCTSSAQDTPFSTLRKNPTLSLRLPNERICLLQQHHGLSLCSKPFYRGHLNGWRKHAVDLRGIGLASRKHARLSSTGLSLHPSCLPLQNITPSSSTKR